MSIWQEVVKYLPSENILYFADQKNFPYGRKEEEKLYQIVSKNVKFLTKQQVKLIVIACNTATVHTLDKLRLTYKLPIVGTVPVVKKAAELSKSGRIGVISTFATSKSRYQKNLIAKFAPDMKVSVEAADWLVAIIEKLELTPKQILPKIEKNLHHLKEKNIDVLVLGCTHFSFAKPYFKKIFGRGVLVLDSAGAIARQVKRVLNNNDKRASRRKPSYVFYTTGDANLFKKRITALLKTKTLVKSI